MTKHAPTPGPSIADRAEPHHLRANFTAPGVVAVFAELERLRARTRGARQIETPKEEHPTMPQYETVKTRTQYLNGEVSHDEYYGQFVTSRLVAYVESRIGRDKILASQDRNLNDIPLVSWDRLTDVARLIDRDKFRAANNTIYTKDERDAFFWSLCDQVCIAKAAARISAKS